MKLAVFWVTCSAGFVWLGFYTMGHAVWFYDLGRFSPFIQMPFDAITGFLGCLLCWALAACCFFAANRCLQTELPGILRRLDRFSDKS